VNIQWKREWTGVAVVGVVSFGVGVGCGYAARFLQTRKTIQDLDEFMQNIEDEALEMVKNNPLPEPEMPEMYYTNPSEELVTRLLHAQDMDNDEVVEEVVSIFTTDYVEEDWDYAEEEKHRGPEKPYVIHRDEYLGEDKGYSQSTLTYYKGDDILCDEHDVPIYNADSIAGPLEFGRGSGDANVVYVRNERLEAEYEILLDTGHYAVEVLGTEIEHRFSRRAPLPKFRDTD